jgi:hypothetical protein
MNKKTYFVRGAKLADLEKLVSFAVLEAKEAEGIDLSPGNVRRGILAALENDTLTNTRAIKAYKKSGFSESDYRIMRMSV